jgi:hypothetical protein
MNPRQQLERRAATYNMVPNLIWTILFLYPVYEFASTRLPLPTALILLGGSMVPLFFPNSFFKAIQLSKNRRLYERLGVRFINKFAQNGALINRYLKKRYPQFKVVAPTRSSIIKTYKQTFLYEKFHFTLFLFTTAATVYSIVDGTLIWALVLTVCNLLYNIYPNLLQQYIRVKLTSAIEAYQIFTR